MTAGSLSLPNQVKGLIRVLREPDAVGSLTRGAAVAFGIQVLSLVCAYASQVFLARWMGISEFGKYSFAVSWASILSMVTALGLPDAVVRFVPEYLSHHRWDQVRTVVNSCREFVILVSVWSAIALVLVGLVLRLLIGYSLATPLVLSGVVGLALAIVRFQSEAFRSLKRIGWATISYNLLRPVFLLAGVTVALLTGASLTSTTVLVIVVGSLAAIAVVQWKYLSRSIPGGTPASQSGPQTRAWIKTALPMLVASASLTVISQFGVLVIGFFRPPDQAGLFAASARVAILVAFVLGAVNTAVAPEIASAFARRDSRSLRRVVESSAHLSFWPSVFVSIFFFVFASKILSLFGSGFSDGVWVLRILIVSQMVNVGVGSVANLLTMTGNQSLCARTAAASAAVTIVGCVVATPVFGAIGAAVATAAGMSLWNLWMYRIVIFRLQVQPSALVAMCSRLRLGSASK